MRSLALALCLTLAAILLPACTTTTTPDAQTVKAIDYPGVIAALDHYDGKLARYEPLVPEYADEIGQVRGAIAKARHAAELRIDLDASLDTLLDLSDRVIAGLDEPSHKLAALIVRDALVDRLRGKGVGL